MTKCVQPDRSNEIDLQPLLDVMIDKLNEHCEKLEQHLEAKIEAFMDSGFAIRSASASRQLNEIFDELVEKKKGHPWHEFLNARAKALRWARIERKYTDEEIAQIFSMDATQVRLILEAEEKFPYIFSENEIRKKYGWVDFDPDKTNDLIDDQNYLVRYQNMDGTWMCTHLAYWSAEEKQFSLLHSTTFMPPIVHQYLKIPE